jgi:hypothetical protein
MDNANQVTVFIAKDPTQAELVKIALENEGIPAALQGESQGGLIGILEIRVNVRAADEDRAREVIAFHQSAEDDLTEEDGLSDEPDAEGIEMNDEDQSE